MTRNSRPLFNTRAAAAVLPLLLLLACSCQTSQSHSGVSVQQQLQDRQRRAHQSMELYEQARAVERDGNAEKAAQLYRKSVEVNGENIYSLMVVGKLELQQERYFIAAAAFQQACRLAPSRYEPRYNLGSVYEAAGRYPDAIREYQAALRLAPEELEVMENLARTLILSGQQPEQARQLIEKSLSREDRPEWRTWLQMQVLRLPPGAEATLSEARR